eukprot:maker-scaffold9_size846264-snap-gene-7.27 protein:Tk08412 transcript:maker-scaffold9_size846264-snap-gene-7.27-mRNA-1 annotation:"protein-lysine methyltransferase mettl21d-like"
MFDRVLRIDVKGPSSRTEDRGRDHSLEEVELHLSQEYTGSESAVVWDAALVLAYYLEHQQESLQLRGQAVVELGSGTGIVGLVAGALGARVVLSDLPEYIPLLEENIAKNRAHLPNAVECRALTWGQSSEDLSKLIPSGVDFVLVSDCIYYEDAIQPLIATLSALCTSRRTRVLFAYEDRSSDEKQKVQKFFWKLASSIFEIASVPAGQCHPDYNSPDIKVAILVKK